MSGVPPALATARPPGQSHVHPAAQLVAGIDGVGSQWVAVLLSVTTGSDSAVRLAAGDALRQVVGSAATVLRASAACAAVGIDVPIGLVPAGRRAAETAARALLGRDSRSIFPTAPAPAFAIARARGTGRRHREAAQVASRAAGGQGISTQSWALTAKILEVEDALRALAGKRAQRVVEVHPETAFRVMARHHPVPTVPTAPAAPAVPTAPAIPIPDEPWPAKRLAAGSARRATLLDQALGAASGWAATEAAAAAENGVPCHDLLDALAAAWSAARVASGDAELLGAEDADRACWSDGTPAPGRGIIAV